VCGIVGNVLARADRRPDQAVVEAMADRLAHRGPDDAGFVVRGPAALGIRRLKIIDLDTGRQPMTGEDGATWVVLNGEIYNYRELRGRLSAAGHVFRTR
jgi:asparagine synthase (glutamine-hydrolysing)